MLNKIFSLSFIFLLLYSSALAHEYWFEPEAFFLKAGEKTPVHLYVGDGLVKDREERPYQRDKTVLFQLFSFEAMTDLRGSAVEGATPVVEFSGGKPGNHLLAMERNWSYIKLEAQKFEDYLREDGMEYVIAERKKLGENQKEGSERYSRFIKSLLLVGDKPDSTFSKKNGWKFEIVPLENPYSKKVGGKLRFQVLFNGRPLAHRAVFADNRDAPTQRMLTDKSGSVTMSLTHKGMWLIRVVTMQRCQRNCEGADWESFWAAYTFGSR